MPYVTRDELEAHLGPMKDDIGEIKQDVKAILAAKYEASFLGGRGHTMLVAIVPVFLAAVISVITALLFN